MNSQNPPAQGANGARCYTNTTKDAHAGHVYEANLY